MNNQTVTILSCLLAVAVALLAKSQIDRWRAARREETDRQRKLNAALVESLDGLRGNLAPLSGLSASVDQIKALPNYLDGMVKVCEEMVKQIILMRESVGKFSVLVTGDTRDPKKVLQMVTEEDQYRATEIMQKVSEGKSWEQAQAEFEEDEQKKMVGVTASAL